MRELRESRTMRKGKKHRAEATEGQEEGIGRWEFFGEHVAYFPKIGCLRIAEQRSGDLTPQECCRHPG
jgi:hypothetical protein